MTSGNNQDYNKKIVLFFLAYRSLIEEPDQIAKKYGLQRVHHRILFFIGQVPGVSGNELLNILEVTKQAMNHPLRELKEKNFIVTETDIKDKRIKRLFLTNDGRRVLDELTQVQIDQMKAIFSKLGQEHVDGWTSVMEEYAMLRPNWTFISRELI